MSPTQLLPTHLALHVLLLLVLSPPSDDAQAHDSPTSSPSSSVQDSDPADLPALGPSFRAALLHLLLRELLAPTEPPLGLEELCDEIRELDVGAEGKGKGPSRPGGSGGRQGRLLAKRLKGELRRLQQVADFFDFGRSLEALLNDRDEDAVGPSAPPLDRRSPLGLAVRRFALRVNAMDFSRVVESLETLGRWIEGSSEGPALEELFESTDPRLSAFKAYLSSLHSSDYTLALSSLQKFFSYPLPLPAGTEEGAKDEGMHHHALLNVASLHFAFGEWESCKLNLDEALRLARSANDQSALEKCLSLSRRLAAQVDQLLPSQRSQAALNAPDRSSRHQEGSFEEMCGADQLWEIGHRSSKGEPLSESFAKLFKVKGTLDREEFPELGLVSKGGEEVRVAGRQEVETGGWESLNAGLWGLLGEDRLAGIRADGLLDPGLGENVGQGAKLACIQSRALRLAHQGHHMASLATLFDPPQLYLTSLSLALYRSWAQTIWTVLGTWAEREGSEDAKVLIALFRGDEQAVRGHEEDEDEEERGAGTRAKDDVEGDLKKALKFKAAHLPSLALPLVLAALETAQRLCLFALFRVCTVTLADLVLDLGEAKYAGDLVDEVFVQILSGEDEELKAFANLTKARSLILLSASSTNRVSLLEQASTHLSSSIEIYRSLSCSHTVLLPLRLQAQVLHSLGRERERDGIAALWEQASADREGAKRVEEVVRRVAKGVMELGVAISAKLG